MDLGSVRDQEVSAGLPKSWRWRCKRDMHLQNEIYRFPMEEGEEKSKYKLT